MTDPAKKHIVKVTLPTDVYAELERVADADYRTVANLITHVTSEWLAGRTYRLTVEPAGRRAVFMTNTAEKR